MRRVPRTKGVDQVTEEQKMVLEFHRKFSLPFSTKFRKMTEAERDFRRDFLLEEADEFRMAANEGDTEGMVDALADIIYVAHGTAHFMGVDLEPIFREVHRANMAKTGGPVRGDGKILKPAGWEPPQVGRLLRLQGWPGDSK